MTNEPTEDTAPETDVAITEHFANLHELLQESAVEEDSHKWGKGTKRVAACVPAEVRERLDQLVRANGTTINAFLKKVCVKLVEEHLTP